MVNLHEFAAKLTTAQLAQSWRNVLRRQARKIRSKVVANLWSNPLKMSPDGGGRKELEEGIRANESRDGRGIRVSIAASKNPRKGMHLNRRGRYKPVLLWAESGTEPRRHKSTWHNTGRMPARHFLRDAERSELPRVRAEVVDAVNRQIQKTCKKHGLI